MLETRVKNILTGGLTSPRYYGSLASVCQEGGVTVLPLGEIKVLTDDIVTVPEAAKQLGKPKMTLYRWIEAGKIVSIKLGGILFIPVTEVERIKNN
ncbi:hypothetical protein ES703_77954 [subsurface metagenome]